MHSVGGSNNSTTSAVEKKRAGFEGVRTNYLTPPTKKSKISQDVKTIESCQNPDLEERTKTSVEKALEAQISETQYNKALASGWEFKYIESKKKEAEARQKYENLKGVSWKTLVNTATTEERFTLFQFLYAEKAKAASTPTTQSTPQPPLRSLPRSPIRSGGSIDFKMPTSPSSQILTSIALSNSRNMNLEAKTKKAAESYSKYQYLQAASSFQECFDISKKPSFLLSKLQAYIDCNHFELCLNEVLKIEKEALALFLMTETIQLLLVKIQCFLFLGAIQKANDVNEVLQKEFPEYGESIHGNFLIKLNKDEPDAANGALQQLKFGFPNYPHLNFLEGKLFMKKHNYSKAAECFSKEMDYPKAVLLLAACYEFLNERNANKITLISGIKLIETEVSPLLIQNQMNLANLLFRSNDIENAKKYALDAFIRTKDLPELPTTPQLVLATFEVLRNISPASVRQ